MAGASPKNPSTLIFWNDLENDEQLRTCSLAAKGLWDHHMLPIAARSLDHGVVLIGEHPCRVDADLPRLLARVSGESPEVIADLLRELVDSGAASVDQHGRIYNRRMVREEAIRRARSAAGKRGAEATNAANLDRRQKSGKHPGKGDGKQSGKHPGKGDGKQSGKPADGEQSLNGVNTGQNRAESERDERQTHDNAPSKDSGEETGDPSDKTAPSSLFMLQASSDVTTTESVERGRANRAQRSNKPDKRRSKLPGDWAVDGALRAWTIDTLAAAKMADRIGIEREIAKFKAHHIAKGSLMLDWSRAWHTWIFNAIEWSEKHGPQRGVGAQSNRQPANGSARTVEDVIADRDNDPIWKGVL